MAQTHSLDSPPDDYTLHVRQWLAEDVYPNHLGEVFDDRAAAVWIDGSQGFVQRWLRGEHRELSPIERREQLKHRVFEAIMRVKHPPATPPRAATALQGVLRLVPGGPHGMRIPADDTGLVIPTFCHFGEAFSAWVHGREREVEDQCRAIADAG